MNNPLLEMAEYAGARALDWRAHAASAGKATNRHSRSMTLYSLRMADIDDRNARILRAAAMVVSAAQALMDAPIDDDDEVTALLASLKEYKAACKENEDE